MMALAAIENRAVKECNGDLRSKSAKIRENLRRMKRGVEDKRFVLVLRGVTRDTGITSAEIRSRSKLGVVCEAREKAIKRSRLIGISDATIARNLRMTKQAIAI